MGEASKRSLKSDFYSFLIIIFHHSLALALPSPLFSGRFIQIGLRLLRLISSCLPCLVPLKN